MSKSQPVSTHPVNARPTPRGEESPATASKPYSLVQSTTEGGSVRAASTLVVFGGRIVDDGDAQTVQPGEDDPLNAMTGDVAYPAAVAEDQAGPLGERYGDTGYAAAQTPEDDGTGRAAADTGVFTAGLGDELFAPTDDPDLTPVTPSNNDALTPTAWLGQWGQVSDAIDLDTADLLVMDDSLGDLLEGIAGAGTADLPMPEINSVEGALDRAGGLDVKGVADLRLRLDLDLVEDGTGGLV